MTAIYGLYANPDAAQRAVNALRAQGVADADIAVMSSEPLAGYEFAERDRSSPMRWIAAGGGVLGCLGGIALTSLTQLDSPLITGSMPVVSMWTNLVVIFELTMLSAILATVITMVATAGFSLKTPRFYDPEVSEGKILVGVADAADDRLADLEGILANGGTVKRL